MNVAHVALWTSDLDRASDFYRDAFGAEVGPTYHSERRPGFLSRFARLATGPSIELMSLPNLEPQTSDAPRIGWAHIAISLGTEDAVIGLATRMKLEGALISGPRWTGDGYFEAVISDPDGNLVEVTV
jgi:lactoylglutathione lyase